MNTEQWKAHIKREAEGICSYCKKEVEILEAHHEIPKDDSSMVAICPNCHRKQHRNITHIIKDGTFELSMELTRELEGVIGKKRVFLLFRIAGYDVRLCRTVLNISQGTYNSWLKKNDSTIKFMLLYKRLPELLNKYSSIILQELDVIYKRDIFILKYWKLCQNKDWDLLDE